MTDKTPYAPSFRLDGKVALVTGASRGIGYGLARALAEVGAKVAVSARDEKLLAELASSIPGSLVVPMDMTSVASINEGVARVEKHFGRLDILVNNAGLGANPPALEVTEIGDKLDVIMVPKVEGADDIHYVDRLLAQLEARAGLERPILVHAILETALGVNNIDEIATASPRMQGMSLGPADLAASRRMKTTRVGGGHPGYLVRSDPTGDDLTEGRTTYQQDLWHYTIARMVDACAAAGILPFYGPFGDIKDVVACEDQFRNAFLLGCVGAWSLHPVQIDIARKVFSPDPADVAHAKEVVEAMGDGAGAVMINGKMEDDASVKQYLVMLDLARQLAERDPDLAAAYDL